MLYNFHHHIISSPNSPLHYQVFTSIQSTTESSPNQMIFHQLYELKQHLNTLKEALGDVRKQPQLPRAPKTLGSVMPRSPWRTDSRPKCLTVTRTQIFGFLSGTHTKFSPKPQFWSQLTPKKTLHKLH
jgi:hypothetical protein